MNKFGVDLGGVIDLLSRHIYSGPEVFVRELLQNSRDALVARAAGSPMPADWSIRVTPADGGDGQFHVVDTGIGLSADEVETLLSTVGGSSKRDILDFRNHDFLGHFGIGLLSCFMVADTITVVSRKDGHNPVRWTGRAEGTFEVEEFEDDSLPVGTRVSLTPRGDDSKLVSHDSLSRLLRHYGEFLPVPVYLEDKADTRQLISGPPPFVTTGSSDQAAVLAYGQSIIGHAPMDAIILDLPQTETKGVAYVLANPTSGREHAGARVYIGRMLLAPDEREVVPDWAFFLRVVLTSEALTPTASRESLVRDHALTATKAGIAQAFREWVKTLADFSRPRLHEFLRVHDLAIRSACVEDDELFRIVGPFLTFETAGGTRTLEDLATASPRLRYVTNTDEFRMLTALGEGPTLINAEYVHHEDLLARASQLFGDVVAVRASIEEALEVLAEPAEHDRRRTAALASRASAALAEVQVEAIVKLLGDESTPSLYVADAAVLARVDMDRAREIATGPWAGALRKASAKVDHARALQGRSELRAQVCLNWASPLVQRLAELADPVVFERSVRLLYVQALLAGRRPLTDRDRALMSQSLDDLITLSVGLGQEGADGA